MSIVKYFLGSMLFAQLSYGLFPTTMTVLWYGALLYLISFWVQDTGTQPVAHASSSLAINIASQRFDVMDFPLRHFTPKHTFDIMHTAFTITLIHVGTKALKVDFRDQHSIMMEKCKLLTIVQSERHDRIVQLAKENGIEATRTDVEERTESDTGDECDQEGSLVRQDTEPLLETFDETPGTAKCQPIKNRFWKRLRSYEPLALKAAKLSPAIRRMIAEADVMMLELKNLLLDNDLLTDDALFVGEKRHLQSRREAFETMYDGDDEFDADRSQTLRKRRPQWVRFDASVTVHDAPDEFYLNDEIQQNDLFQNKQELDAATQENARPEK